MNATEQQSIFAALVRDHMGIVLRTAYAFATGADRDDLAQEILLAAWQALPAYDERRCKLSTFLYRVANNRALNWHRSRSRYRRKLEQFAAYPHIALATEADSAAPQPQLEWLYDMLRRLPPADRALIMLQLDQLSLREIADVTGLSESNVGVRLHRIKQWLSNQKPTHPDDL